MYKYSLAIINHHHDGMVLDLVNQLLGFKEIAEVCIVDNSKTLPAYHTCEKVRIFRRESIFGFASNMNFIFSNLRELDTRFVVCNPDITFNANIFEEVNSLDFDWEILAPSLIENSEVAGNWRRMPTLLSTFVRAFTSSVSSDAKPLLSQSGCYNLEACSGAFIIVSQTAYKTLSGFSEKYFLYFEDMDFCRRAKRTNLSICGFFTTSVEHAPRRFNRKKLRFIFYYICSLIRYLRDDRKSYRNNNSLQ